MSATDDPMVAALLREREGYRNTGRPERAAQVDEQLALRGYKDPEKEPPRARSAPPRHTADGDTAKAAARPARKSTDS